MTTRFCPDCGAEYIADVDECADCLVPLVGGGLSADSDGGDEVVYELDDWEPELLEQLTDALGRNAIPFSWEENRNLVVRDSLRLPWREIQWALRRLEDRGLVRGGRFVAGFSGEQYALPAAVEQLARVRKTPLKVL